MLPINLNQFRNFPRRQKVALVKANIAVFGMLTVIYFQGLAF